MIFPQATLLRVAAQQSADETTQTHRAVRALLRRGHAHDARERHRGTRLALPHGLAPDRLLVVRARDGVAVEHDARVRRDERVEGAVKVRVALRAVERAQVLLHPVGEDGEVDVLRGGHGGLGGL